nr:hypothetical protein [Occallatibacter savannae]
MLTVPFVADVLEIASWPEAVPTVVGLKVRVTFSDWPGLRVAGKLTDEAEKPDPVTETEFTVTAAVPVELRVTVCVVEWPTTIAPKAMLLAFTVSAPEAAFNCSDTDFDVPPVEAVTVAAVVVLTAATLAEKVAELAVAGMDIEPGTATEPLLLARATVTPPEGAEAERDTVQVSASAPVMEVLPQVRPFRVGATVEPVPLKLTAGAVTLPEIASLPVTAPAAAGSN